MGRMVSANKESRGGLGWDGVTLEQATRTETSGELRTSGSQWMDSTWREGWPVSKEKPPNRNLDSTKIVQTPLLCRASLTSL